MSREVVFVECLCSCVGCGVRTRIFLVLDVLFGRDQIEVTRCKLVGFLCCDVLY